MILFFYGPNTFLIHRKICELKQKYVGASGSDLNLLNLEGAEITLDQFLSQAQAMPLLATSRLIVIEGILKNKSKETLEKIKENLGKISSSTNVVFVEYGEPDKRTSFFKALANPSYGARPVREGSSPNGVKSQYFGMLDSRATVKFICDEVLSHNAAISPAAAEILSEYSLGNLWFLSSEIGKLVNFVQNRPISAQDVELLSTRNISSNTFALVDFLAKRDTPRALRELEKLITTSEPPLKILSLINYQFRSIAQIKDAREFNTKAPLSPYQFSKLNAYSDKFSWRDLSQIYGLMMAIDEKIKTGKIEPVEGLKELVLNF